MLTPDQVAILLLAWVGAATVVCLFLAAGTGPTMPRHGADVADPPAGPPTAPILLGQGAGVPDTIRLPRPRPYSGGIPVLVVDGPPSGHGRLPVGDDFPAPIVRVTSCSLCRDGQVVMSRDGICPWCGHGRAAAAS